MILPHGTITHLHVHHSVSFSPLHHITHHHSPFSSQNHNSSRFGKFIELRFDDHNRVIGASITEYLQEKSRVVHRVRNIDILVFSIVE